MKVCFLCLPPGFPAVPPYYHHASVAPRVPLRTGRADFPHPAPDANFSLCLSVSGQLPQFPPLCIDYVFLLLRSFTSGNLHSARVSRFSAKPVPVPLRGRRLSASFHVGTHTPRPGKSSPHAGFVSLPLLCSMLSSTPGARSIAIHLAQYRAWPAQ